MATGTHDNDLARRLRATAEPLSGRSGDYDGLFRNIGHAHLVLLGEASHGTHDFYWERARITERLIEENGFNAVAIEGDWPAAHRVNRYVRGRKGDASAAEALSGFDRFPRWLWRNSETVRFVEWLRTHNARVPAERRAGFYGLDLYATHASIDAVLRFLEDADGGAADRARERYSHFEHFASKGGDRAEGSEPEPCEDRIVEELVAMQRRAGDEDSRDGRSDPDAFFFAEQTTRLEKRAPRYFRALFRGSSGFWNLRDRHMSDTLEELRLHIARTGADPKIVVWAHNAHLGDARRTEMSRRGEVSVGQLVRERNDRDAFLVGFTTYEGTVAAASEWQGRVEKKRIRPALPDSHEAVLHRVGVPRFVLTSPQPTDRSSSEARLERSIGVVYRPETERASHYFEADLRGQFDAVVHLDETRALTPLDDPDWNEAEDAMDDRPRS
jgi:erythromycin esterase-like protein